jgi:hypothetical protein
MIRVIDTIENCNDCPYSFRSDVYWYCTNEVGANGNGRTICSSNRELETDPPPGWCPLRLCEMVVRLKEGGR